MSFCDYCSAWFIEHLERDIAAHESGRYDEIGVSDGDMPEYDLIENSEAATRLGIACNFRGMWADDYIHEWSYYDGVEEHDWPIIARQIVRGLREKWTPEQMMKNAALDEPSVPPHDNWWQRLKRAFGGE